MYPGLKDFTHKDCQAYKKIITKYRLSTMRNIFSIVDLSRLSIPGVCLVLFSDLSKLSTWSPVRGHVHIDL